MHLQYGIVQYGIEFFKSDANLLIHYSKINTLMHLFCN